MSGLVKTYNCIVKQELYYASIQFGAGFNDLIINFGYPIPIVYNRQVAKATGMYIVWQRHICYVLKLMSGKIPGRKLPMISIQSGNVQMLNICILQVIFNNWELEQ